jgi:hypothetical protein
MMASLINYLFGCSHERTTFPMRTKGSGETNRQGTYIVCLDCGKEFDYNWKEMHAGAAVPKRPAVTLFTAGSR